MSKAVMLSIRPKWCEKIASGEKTVEVRKTRPSWIRRLSAISTARCKAVTSFFRVDLGRDVAKWNRGKWADRKGNVIGEFTCDRIDRLAPANEPYGIYDIDDDYVLQTCLENGALWDYGHGTPLYGWHISNLRIYDAPRELSEFERPYECNECDAKWATECNACHEEGEIKRPPQSWCYVEED